MKLISNTNYGLLIVATTPIITFAKLRTKYDLFLSQKLEKWMFVPCKLVDKNWVVLEEPKTSHLIDLDRYDAHMENIRKEHEEYQKAKNNVLFKGFEMYSGKPYNNELQRAYIVDYWWTIEHIVHWNLDLTDTAQKYINEIESI